MQDIVTRFQRQKDKEELISIFVVSLKPPLNEQVYSGILHIFKNKIFCVKLSMNVLINILLLFTQIFTIFVGMI